MPSRNATREPHLLEQPDDGPPEIELAGPHTHAGRFWERMVVVMESFAEGQDAEDPDIGSALPGALDDEPAFAPGMRRVADGPVANDPCRGARANADGHATGPEDEEDRDREKEHVDGHRPLQEPGHWIA